MERHPHHSISIRPRVKPTMLQFRWVYCIFYLLSLPLTAPFVTPSRTTLANTGRISPTPTRRHQVVLSLALSASSNSNSRENNDKNTNDDPYGPLQDGESIQVAGSYSRKTNQTSHYTIKRTGHVYFCSCPAWKFQHRPSDARTCKHINSLRVGYPPILAASDNTTTTATTTVQAEMKREATNE